MTDPNHTSMPFDRRLWHLRRNRAAQLIEGVAEFEAQLASAFCERILDTRRNFPRAAILGAGSGKVAQKLQSLPQAGRDLILQIEAAPGMARLAAKTAPLAPALCADEESLPLKEGYFDLILAPFTLHMTNDLPGSLVQIRRALRPDGLFIGALAGEGSLLPLRESLMQAEVEVEGGVSPRLMPLAGVRDLGALLMRAGFALPVADTDTHPIAYRDPMRLLYDIRALGMTNILRKRRRWLSRTALLRGVDLLAEAEHIPLEVIWLTGWAPDKSQPKPLKPGSAQTSLANVLRAGLNIAVSQGNRNFYPEVFYNDTFQCDQPNCFGTG